MVAIKILHKGKGRLYLSLRHVCSTFAYKCCRSWNDPHFPETVAIRVRFMGPQDPMQGSVTRSACAYTHFTMFDISVKLLVPD